VITFLFCLIGWFVSAVILAYRDGQKSFVVINAALAIVTALVLYFHQRPA